MKKIKHEPKNRPEQNKSSTSTFHLKPMNIERQRKFNEVIRKVQGIGKPSGLVRSAA